MVNPTRNAKINRFLEIQGWHPDHRRPLAEDASFRRYERLIDGWRRAVLMDAPPDHEDVKPFIQVANRLRAFGLSAPEILASDPENGFLLLEDLGDDTLSVMLRKGADERTLYAQSLEVLIQLRQAAGEGDTDPDRQLPAYGIDQAFSRAKLFVDWWLEEQLSQGEITKAYFEDASGQFEEAWRAVLPCAYQIQSTVTLYDYMVDNLIWLPDRDSPRSVGLLDFQDAVWAPPTYDLASLFEDARRDVSPAIAEKLLNIYVDRFHAQDRIAFETSYAIMAAQRSTRILGVFTRLWRRDGKPNYLKHRPRVWRWLQGDLEHPSLQPVKTWFDQWVPPTMRDRDED